MTKSDTAGFSASELGTTTEPGNYSGKRAIAKIEADINLLRDRIALMRAQSNPNSAVLDTYTTMLTRRELALSLMLHNNFQR